MEPDDELIEERERPDARRRLWRNGLGVLLVLVLMGVAVAGGVIWGERRAASSGAPKNAPAGARSGDSKTDADFRGGSMSTMPGMGKPQAPSANAEEVVEVSLTAEAVERAGIKTAEVETHAAGAALTVPATVTSNAYRDTKVNALVGGIVRQVSAELGVGVQLGQPLAVIFSSELAEAQMKYLSMQAMLHADHQKLKR